jgi:hypothetical protein
MYAKRENFLKTCTSSFSIAMGYRLSSQGLNADGDKIFLFLHNFQTGSGTYPASYPMGTGDKAARV